MVVHKYIITLAGILSLSLAVCAQDAGVPQPVPSAQQSAGPADAASFLDSSPESLGAVVNLALESAQNWVVQKGWSMGINRDGRFVAVGSAGVSVPPSDSQFAQMRANAYTKAMLDAKVNLAKFIGTQIKTEVLHGYGQGSGLRERREAMKAVAERQNAGLLSKVRMFLSAKLDNMLRKEGVEMDSPKAVETAGKLLNSDSFNQVVETSAKAAVAGLVCAKIFEENGKIAVVAYYSDNTRILAGAIRGSGVALFVAPDPGLTGWINSLTPAQLYPVFGVQLKADENGNIAILSHGQAVSQTESPNSIRNARTQAEAMADAYLRQFAGEFTVYDNVVENIEQTNEFDTGMIDATTETYQQTTLRSVSEKLNISGIQTVKTWQTKDTRSGKLIVGVVKKWTIESADAARRVRAELARPPAQRGNLVPVPQRAAPSAPAPDAPYKIESIGSEDF